MSRFPSSEGWKRNLVTSPPNRETTPADSRELAHLRSLMVDRFVAARGIQDQRVLEAMRQVPRHVFVPLAMAAKAYGQGALPIGHQQTISQPYIVARMIEL